MNWWNILEISCDSDLKTIKKAYAKLLKIYNPEDDAEGYQKLREAYDKAIKDVKRKNTNTQGFFNDNSNEINSNDLNMDKNEESTSEGYLNEHITNKADSYIDYINYEEQDAKVNLNDQISEFVDSLNIIYNDMSLRINSRKWEELLNSDVVWNVQSYQFIADEMFKFLVDHKYLPVDIWTMLDKNFNWTKHEINLYNKYSSDAVDGFLKNLKNLKNPNKLKYDYLGSLNSQVADKYLCLREQAYESLENKDYYNAEKYLIDAESIFSYDAELLRLIGNYNYNIGKLDKALEFYKSAFEINKNDLNSALRIGIILVVNERFNEALQYFELYLPYHNDDKLALNNIGYCYYYTNNLFKAKESFEKLLRIRIKRNFQRISSFENDNVTIKNYLVNIELKLEGKNVRTIKFEKYKPKMEKVIKNEEYKPQKRKSKSKLRIIGIILLIIIIYCGLWRAFSHINQSTRTTDDSSATVNKELKEKENREAENDKIKAEINKEFKLPEPTEDDKITPDLEPKIIVAKYLDNVKKLYVSNASKYTVDKTINFKNIKKQMITIDESTAHYNAFFKKMMDYDYEIGDTQINGDKASVQITLKTYNFTIDIMDARLYITDSQLANEISKGKEYDEDIAQRELSKILDPKERKLEIPVKLTLTKTQDGWRIDNGCIEDNLYYAITGNTIESIEYYNEYYIDPSKYDGSISMDSYNKFLESKGIIYDENSKTSPFKKE